jgi:NADP-dependent aldehyde dehydrogenase
MKLTGKQIINGNFAARGTDTFNSMNATLNTPLDTAFTEATDEELGQAAQVASEAFIQYRKISHADRAAFLRNIASEIEKLGDELIETASMETALTADRLKGERQRTINQLNAFAKFIETPEWVRPVIDKQIQNASPYQSRISGKCRYHWPSWSFWSKQFSFCVFRRGRRHCFGSCGWLSRDLQSSSGSP